MRTFAKLLPLLCLALSCARGTDVPVTPTFSDEKRIVSDEISNLRISSFAEDTLGHIWIGTFRGLNKFNSYEFTQYFCTDDDSDLSDSQINSVFCDSKGRIWVATINGVCIYTDRDNFRRIPLENKNLNCRQFIEDRTGRIFLNNVFQLLVYDEDAEKFVCVDENLDPDYTFNETGYVDAENGLWMVNPLCLRRYSAADILPVDSIAVAGHPNVSYLQDGRKLWLAGNGSLQIFDVLTRRFSDAPSCLTSCRALLSASVRLIHPYGGGLLFDTERGGLFFYDPAAEAVWHEGESGFPFDAPGFGITAMFTDSCDNLWIGSVDQGYRVYYSSSRKFNYDRPLCAAFEGKSVTSLELDSMNRLWIATYKGGLWVYDTGTKSLAGVNLPFEAAVKKYNPWINYIFADEEGSVWIILDDRIVMQCRWDGKTLITDNTYHIDRARFMTQDTDGTFWLSCSNWLVYSKRRGEREFVPHQLYEPGMTFVPTMLPMPDGSVLAAGFLEPITRISTSDGSVEALPISEEDYSACIQRSVLIPVTMFRDSRGEVWIGTISNGLLKYSPADNRLVRMGGVSSSDISGIEEDRLGNVWVSTLHGLSEYERTSGQFINWYAHDGIGGNQFHERSSCILPDGTLVFGGTHGLTVFDPKDLNEKRTVSVVFEDLKVFNELVVPGTDGTIDRHLSLHPDIRLKHNQNGFSISFSALYYNEFQRIRYSYRMEGFDNYWIDAGNSHEANYSNLPAGRYTFRVGATDHDKSILSAENSILIRVLPSPWLSWWAVCIYVLIALATSAEIVRLMLKNHAAQETALRERMEKEQEQKVNRMNMSFFSNVSHEFRTPLTMISGPVAQLSADPSVSGGNRKLLRMVSRNVDRMLKLVNQLLYFNKLENDALKLKVRRTDIIAVLRQQTDLYRIWCEEKGISLSAYGLEDTFLMYLDLDNLDNILANLMSNAIKYTSQGGGVEVYFDVISGRQAAELFGLEGVGTDWQYVKISVADTGPGIPEDKLEKIFEKYYQIDGSGGNYHYGSGIGLYYAKSLAQLHHGCLKAGNRDGGGAVFTLILPASDPAYSEAEIDTGAEAQYKAYPLVGNTVEYDPAGGSVDGGISDIGEGSINASESVDDSAVKGKATVLVVDDDPDVVHYLQTLLSGRYRVICRFDVDSALEIMEKDVPDIVVCDVMMPGKDGYEMCREVKANLQLCHIPVILLTAKVATQDVVEGLDSGAEAYITKPFNPSVLLSAINSQLMNRERISLLLNSATDVGQIEENNLSPQDKAFMDDLYRLMEEEITNSELNVVGMAEQLHISRTKIYYKVKGLTGESPSNFFKTYKLNRAAELLREGRHTISEIADLTGFSTLSHFSISFKKQFGVPPSEYGK